MKLSKKLMTLLGASALSMGALVPVAGVSAATPETSKLPAATTGGINDTTGTASAQSNAHVEINGGYLILNQVPDFNFGTVQRGSSNDALVDNTNPDGVASDGNSDGTLQVTDYRGGQTKTNLAYGYSVTATIGKFVTADSADMNADAVMHLKATDGTTALDDAGTGSSTTTSVAADLNNGTAAPVLNLAAGTGYGITKINFNTAGAATLDVPNMAASGSYNAPITWTLNAAAPTN